jgi:hypothetical protein
MIKELLETPHQDLSFMNSFDDCILGVSQRFGEESIIAYNYQKIITKLVGYGMSEDEANNCFKENLLGRYIGDQTPCFIDVLE